MKIVLTMDDAPLIQVSPLLMDNHFLPLPHIDGEEDVKRIASITLPPIIFLPLDPT